MSTDWKALCKELVDALHEHTSLYEGHECELVTRARAALALGIDQPLHATMKELVVHFAGELLAIDAMHHGIRAHEVARLWFGDPVLMTNPIIERACMAFIEDYGDALAQPEPEGPTDEELLSIQDQAVASFPPLHPDAEALSAVEYARELEIRKARAVLALNAHPTPQPIPVAERLPEAGDCDAEGRCWAWDRLAVCWRDVSWEEVRRWADTHWLPSHALPLPTNNHPEHND